MNALIILDSIAIESRMINLLLSNMTIMLCAIAIALSNTRMFLSNRWIVLCNRAIAIASIAKMEQLRQLIRHNLKGHSRAGTTITAVEQGSKPELDRLTVYLQDAMEDDPQFAAEVKAIALIRLDN